MTFAAGDTPTAGYREWSPDEALAGHLAAAELLDQRVDACAVPGLKDLGTGLAGLAAEAGYADQAHLTRECGRLGGTTPARLVRPAGLPVADLVAA